MCDCRRLVSLTFESFVNSVLMSILVNPLYILKTCIKSCLFLLSSSVHKFRCLSLSNNLLPFTSANILVNLNMLNILQIVCVLCIWCEIAEGRERLFPSRSQQNILLEDSEQFACAPESPPSLDPGKQQVRVRRAPAPGRVFSAAAVDTLMASASQSPLSSDPGEQRIRVRRAPAPGRISAAALDNLMAST